LASWRPGVHDALGRVGHRRLTQDDQASSVTASTQMAKPGAHRGGWRMAPVSSRRQNGNHADRAALNPATGQNRTSSPARCARPARSSGRGDRTENLVHGLSGSASGGSTRARSTSNSFRHGLTVSAAGSGGSPRGPDGKVCSPTAAPPGGGSAGSPGSGHIDEFQRPGAPGRKAPPTGIRGGTPQANLGSAARGPQKAIGPHQTPRTRAMTEFTDG